MSVDVSRVKDRLRFVVEDAMLVGTDQTRSDIAGAAPVRSGRLADAFQQSVAVSATSVTARISNDTGYARYVVEGTGPHEIRAVEARSLAFYWPRAGRMVFAKSVQHPGTAPNRFWSDGLARWADNVRGQL